METIIFMFVYYFYTSFCLLVSLIVSVFVFFQFAMVWKCLALYSVSLPMSPHAVRQFRRSWGSIAGHGSKSPTVLDAWAPGAASYDFALPFDAYFMGSGWTICKGCPAKRGQPEMAPRTLEEPKWHSPIAPA